MNILVPTKITRYIFAVLLGMFGIFHFMNADGMAAYIPSWLPGPASMWVYVTGVAILLFAVSFLINKKARLAGYLMALFLILTVIFVHIPGGEDSMPMVLKDLALAMGCIAYANMLDE